MRMYKSLREAKRDGDADLGIEGRDNEGARG